MEILNRNIKLVFYVKMSILFVLALSVFYLNPDSQFNIIASFLLVLVLFVRFFQFYKKIIINKNELLISYLNRPFNKQKKIKSYKIKFIWFKVDNLRFLSLPCVSFFSFQFPFFFDLYVNSIDEVAIIIKTLKKNNNAKIKPPKNRLEELSKMLKEDNS